MGCRNFGKELVILIHRSAAAPLGHMVSIIKKIAPQEILSHLVPLPQLLASGPFRSSPLTVYVFGTFHHRDTWATNARAEFKGTGHTQLSSSRHFICKLTSPTLPSPSQTLSNLLYNNLATKPYITFPAIGTLWTPFWTVTYTFVV